MTFRSTRFLLPLLSLLLLTSCSIRHDFAYKAAPIEQLSQGPLRIAVLPFKDMRELKDEGSKNYAYIPLVPTSAKVTDAPQRESDRFKAEYYFPDLIAYGLVLDLEANRAGSVVHFAPEVTEDYDIIIDGKLLSMARTDRSLTYGLSAGAFALHMFGIPKGAKAIDFDAVYRVRQANGKVVHKSIHEADWTSVREGMPFMEGINSAMRDNNTAFLTEFAPTLKRLNRSDLNAKRKRYFYAAIDPDLKKLDQLRQKLIRSKATKTKRFRRLLAEMKRRENWIEKYRRAERKIVEAQQRHFFRKQEIRLQKISQIRTQRRQILAQQQQMEAQQSRRAMKQLSGALVAGALPALKSANSIGTWHTDHTMMALQDTSSAFSAIQADPSLPPPDLSQHLKELDVSFEGLESAAAHTHRADPRGSIEFTRRKFKKWYRRRITPLNRL